jgi:predicted O-linked N-acetylglucosamine transferase (SPINDLY family)
MARGAAQAQRKRRAQPQAKKKQRSAPSWEEQLFFSRLRRHAKVIYVLLALAFAIGFVAFGVGSGSTGIGDSLRGLFSGGSGSSASSRIKDEQKKIQADPNNIQAYLALASFYQQDNKNSQAISTLERAAKAKPKNLDVLNALARIYRSQAGTAQNTWATAENALAESNLAPPGLEANSTLGQALTSDPLSQQLKTAASDAYFKLTSAFTKAEDAYKRVASAARGTPNEANTQLQLASVAIEAIQTTGLSGSTNDVKTAIEAYKRYLKLEPNGVSAKQAKQTLAQLEALIPKNQR